MVFCFIYAARSFMSREKKKKRSEKYCEDSAIKPRWDQIVFFNLKSGTMNNVLSEFSYNNERFFSGLTDISYGLIVPLFLLYTRQKTYLIKTNT